MPTTEYIPLVQRAQQGDAAAFTALVMRFQDLALGAAFGWTGEYESARDVTQEAFLDAHLHLYQLREPVAFPSWLRQIVRKHCDRSTRRKQHGADTLRVAVATPASAEPEQLLAAAEQAEKLHFAVARLPAAERIVVALHYFAGASGPVLAEFLELPLSTVKQRLRRARARLRNEGDRLINDAVQHLRPSNTHAFTQEIHFFVALRAGDCSEVRRLLEANPALVDAQQEWDAHWVHDGVLPFATRATALVTAVEQNNPTMLTLLLDAGADVNGRCGCATAESPLWTATVLNRAQLAQTLLARGADPNLASVSGCRPLHLAAMRGREDIARMLLTAGADPGPRDSGGIYPSQWSAADGAGAAPGGRTPAQWAQQNGHATLAAELRAAEAGLRLPTSTTSTQAPLSTAVGPRAYPGSNEVWHTGIKALDLFAPLPKHGLVRFPFKAGVGMIVLLGELSGNVVRQGGAALWTGFAQPPFDVGDIETDMAEFGMQDHVDVSFAAFGESPPRRRAAFQRGLDRVDVLRRSGRHVLTVLLTAPGFEDDIDASLLRLTTRTGPGSVTGIVVSGFPEQPDAEFADLQAPFSAQIVLDRVRAKRRLFPALHPVLSKSALLDSAVLGEQHARLACEAAALLERYVSVDPTFEQLNAREGAATDPADPRWTRPHQLLRYLCQPFQTTEPFTGRPGQTVAPGQLLETVSAILKA